jgi:hypothetical protein
MKKIYFLIFSFSLLLLTASSQIKINEVYGGGGNSGSTWKNDFIELYNPTASPVSLAGWSVQYNSAAGATAWAVTNLTGTIPANGYYLVQEAVGAGGTTSLPTPDATGTIAMSATAGKVILCNVTAAQTGANPAGAVIIDKVGYGSTATGFEGAPTPAPSNTASVQRTSPGFDTDNNNTDFVTLTPPTPTNSLPDVIPPTISSLSPANSATGVPPAFQATVTFSEAVVKGTGNIVLKKNSDNSVIQTIDVTTADVTLSGSSASFIIQSLDFSTAYYFEIASGAFKDNANNNFAGNTGSGTWSFTTTVKPTGTIGTTYDFAACSGYLNSGFTEYSVVGNQQLWACTTFGVDATHTPTGSAPNGLQINGFNVTNILNEDWLISPAFDLTATTFPLLSYWSRTKFNGLPLSLKVSTNYPGFGNPNNYTWAAINGKFPGQTSDVWTQSSNINLSAFKTTNVYFAFVYYSSADDGARWTLDDILVTNSPTAPPPSLTTSTNDIQFGFAAAGNNVDKTFIVTGNDITGDITLTSSAGFTLADNAGGPFNSSLTLTQPVSNNIPRTVYVRFSPSQNNLNYTGTVTVSTPSVTNVVVNLNGTSIDPANTLEVVNWNMEWFGSTTLGPTNDAQQQANVQTILQNIGADLYGLVEVVDESRLATIVGNMPGYSYVICNYGSHTNTNESGATPLNQAQKEAFVYKTALFSNITTQPLVSQGINSAADLTNPAYNYFASGRFPYMMTADVTLNSVTKTIRFVLLHAKANTAPTLTSYNRRKSGSDTLHQVLNTLYPADNIVFLGDINDDLDFTITDGIIPNTTSYVAFTTDNTNFSLPTLALSLAGKKSTVSYNDMIDHVILSNEMQPYYMASSANVLSDVSSLVANYGSTTTDHYPVFTRYTFTPVVLPVRLLSFTAIKQGSITQINWVTSQEVNTKEFVVERSANGINWQPVITVSAAGNSGTAINYTVSDNTPAKGINLYRLRSVDNDNRFDYSAIRKVNFDSPYTYSMYPNPAADYLNIYTDNLTGLKASVQIINAQGTILINKPLNVSSTSERINVAALASGLYFVKIISADGKVTVQKFTKQ